MEPRRRIASMLKQWLDSVRAESHAVQAGDLPALRKIQAARAELRAPLAEAVEQWRAENPAEAAANPFRSEVDRLLALETQNSNLIAALKHQAQEKKLLLEQALFNLRRVRNTYAKPAETVLASYS